jgi:hypothetical protein
LEIIKRGDAEAIHIAALLFAAHRPMQLSGVAVPLTMANLLC